MQKNVFFDSKVKHVCSSYLYATVFSLYIAPAEVDSRPEVPTVCDLTEDHVTDTTITIAWRKPEDCEEEITAYRITCSLKEEQDGGGRDGAEERAEI